MISNSGHVMTLANSIIGVGILAMPFCFQKCGILLSIVLLIINNLITRLSCHYLIKASLLTRRKSFEFLGFHSFGSSGKLLVELGIIGYLIGSCITYFVVVGDVGPQIVAKILGYDSTDGLRTWVMVLVTIFCILPLGMLKNVDSLSAVCTASVGFYFCLIVKVVLESERHIIAGDWQKQIVYWEPSGVLQCLPIFSMALSCQMQLFEVLESVNNQSLEKLNEIIKNATWMCTLVYIAVGFFGYVAFCTQTFSGNILVNFTPSFGSDIIKIGFVLSVAFSFPLVIFPCRASIYSLLYRRGHGDTTGYIPETRFKCITTFIAISSLCIALLIPSIELVIGLVGSTIGVAICIIFPAACFRKISKKESTEKSLAQAIIVGGCCLMILGTYANLNAIDEQRSISSQSVVDMVNQAVTPLTILHHDKSPDVQLHNLSYVDNKVKISSIEKPKVLHEKSEKKSQTSPPLPVDEVDQVVEVVKENIPVKPIVLPTQQAELSLEPVLKEAPLNSNGIAKEAIKNNEAIAAEEQQQKDGDKKEHLEKAQNELKKTKELLERKVDELKEELAKQNKLTQDLVVEKLGQVVEKVEEIEREVQMENKKADENKPKPVEPISVPKGSILRILTDNNKINASKDGKKQAVYEPLSYKTGEIVHKAQEVNEPLRNAQDSRVPLPLPLLINASQSEKKETEQVELSEFKKGLNDANENNLKPLSPPKPVGIKDDIKTEEVKNKLPVEEVQNKFPVEEEKLNPIQTNNSKDLEVEKAKVEKEKDNVEAIRRDILEVNPIDSLTTLKASREKRSPPLDEVAKFEEKPILKDIQVESLMPNNGLDIKYQGLGRDLKSAKDEK